MRLQVRGAVPLGHSFSSREEDAADQGLCFPPDSRPSGGRRRCDERAQGGP